MTPNAAAPEQTRRRSAVKLDPRERLIVALDVSSVAEAEALIARLGETVTFYKIGYQLGLAGGLALVERLAGGGKQGLVDMKLREHRVTVPEGGKSVAALGGRFLAGLAT